VKNKVAVNRAAANKGDGKTGYSNERAAGGDSRRFHVSQLFGEYFPKVTQFDAKTQKDLALP
jgi:hypothetical protein